MAATFVNPLEVIKVRQMIKKDSRSSLIQGAKMVYASGGILAFYEGLSAALVQVTAFLSYIYAFLLNVTTHSFRNRFTTNREIYM